MEPKKHLTIKEQEELNDFQAGQIDILNWLEQITIKEISKTRNDKATDILNLNSQEFEILKASYITNQILLANIQKIQKEIKGK